MKAVRRESLYDGHPARARCGGTKKTVRRIGRFAVLLSVLLNPLIPRPGYAMDSCVAQPTSSSYFVAINGNDSNPGTQSQPFRTLQKAQSVVRSVSGGMSADIVVYVRGGTYQLSNTLVFNSQDSGTNGHTILYTSYPGEAVHVSGGQTISGWTPVGNGIYKAAVGSLDFRQLYINGTPGIRARSPNVGSFNRLRYWDEAKQAVVINAGDISNWGNLNQVEMVIHKEWQQDNLRIRSYSVSGDSATVVPMEPDGFTLFYYSYGPLRKNNQVFYMENAYELLDSPGEWYLNKATGTLYYMPRAGENMSSATIVAPVLEQLVKVQGTLDTPVRNIKFQGISFENTTWLLPSRQGFSSHQGDDLYGGGTLATASIHIENAENLVFEGNVFHNLGGIGVGLHSGVHDSKFIGNVFADISASGIVTDMQPFVAERQTDLRVVNQYNVVKNNYFTRIARDYHSSIGIFSGITIGTLIEHNELFDMPYTGINGGWFGEDNAGKQTDTPHKNTTIQYNKIHNVANLMSDGAGIYTLGKQPGTRIFENYIFDLHKSSWAGGNLIAGVYLDGSSNMTIENNIVEDTNLGHYIGSGLFDILINLTGNVRDDLPSAHTYINNGNIDPNRIKANAGIEPAFQSILSESTSVTLCSTVNPQVQTGYNRIQPRISSAITFGLAVVDYSRDGLLISEAAFPTSPLIRSGRIYAEIQDSVNTGISIANPNAVPVNLDFLFTDAGGGQLYFGRTSIVANGHITAFLSEPPFAPPPDVPLGSIRTFTFSASSPIAFTALRGFANERSEFLIAPLPVAELNSTSAAPIAFPYYVDGAGWETEIQLVNPTDAVLSGVVNFFPALDTASSAPDFIYEIPSRSAVSLRTLNLGSEPRTGWVRVSPLGGTTMPSGLLLFSFHANGVTVSQAGIQGTREASEFRLYAGASGAFGLGEHGSMQTGFAISNPASTTAEIDLELFAVDGTPMGRRGSLTVPAKGQITMFLDQVPGLQSLQIPFVGLLRISGSPVAVVGLKGRYNERGDFLLTPMAPITLPLTSSSEVFSFFADGGGYTTQSIVFGSFGEIVLP